MLEVIPELKERWQLSDLKRINYNDVNTLYTCQSATYGACVLKQFRESKECLYESAALRLQEGSICCKLHLFDLENSFILIERILPGTRLRQITELDFRLQVFLDVHKKTILTLDEGHIFPSYLDWVERIADYMQTRTVDYPRLASQMERSRLLCRELWVRHNRLSLLHGDLHHDNILLGEEGYRIIDPKGVAGDPVFDLARFIFNEFDDFKHIDPADFKMKFMFICKTIAKANQIPLRDLFALSFIEMAMGYSWTVEDGDTVTTDDLNFVESILDAFM